MYTSALFGLTRTADPVGYPVTTDECKQYLRLETSADDTLIAALISVATTWVETYTGRSLLTQTWTKSLDRWPEDFVIRLPMPPLQTVNSIKWYDFNGTQQTLDPGLYVVDTATARISPPYGKVWPIVRPQLATISINYDAGYGDTADLVPDGIKQALKYLVSHWYETRTPILASGAVPQEVPFAVESLLIQHKEWTLY